MLQYDNRGFALFTMLFRTEGSVLPDSYKVALFPAFLALVFELAARGLLGAEAQSNIKGMIRHPFACQIFAVVLGYVVVFRTNMALNRYWEGISNVQKMYCKWSDAYCQIVAFAK